MSQESKFMQEMAQCNSVMQKIDVMAGEINRISQAVHELQSLMLHHGLVESRQSFINRMSQLAVSEAQSIGREVLGGDMPHQVRTRVMAPLFRAYCERLMDLKISLPHGKYEPHACFFRAFMVERLRMLRPFIQEEGQR
jgi:hypothetical protein